MGSSKVRTKTAWYGVPSMDNTTNHRRFLISYRGQMVLAVQATLATFSLLNPTRQEQTGKLISANLYNITNIYDYLS